MLAIYTRLSRDEINSNSIENQEDFGIQYAKKIGIDYKIYIDEGISGTLPTEERPNFEVLLDDIDNGIITKVWVSRQDRLERNPEVWFYAIKLFKENNVELIFGDKGVFDYNDADKMFEGSIQSIINKRYVDTLAAASKRQIQRNIEKGFVHGTPAYGFKKGEDRRLIIDEDEAKIIKEIYELSLKGIGTTTIAKMLNERGEKTSYNKIGKGEYYHTDQFGKKTIFKKSETKWKGNTIYSIIKSPLYKGIRVWKGKEYEVDKIIEPDKWKLVNDNLTKNKNNTGKKVYHQYLLKGLLKCQKCGRNMNGKKRVNKSDNFYYCASKRVSSGGCGNRSINIDALEGVIWSLFFKEGKLMNFLKNEIEKDEDNISSIESQISLCEKKIETLINQRKRLIKVIRLSESELENDEDFVSELNSIKIEIKDEQHKISDFQLQIANAKRSEEILKNYEIDFEKYTDDLTFLQKREIINKYIYQIWVSSWDESFVKNWGYVYSLVIKFKFKKEDEHFILFRKNNSLYSVNRKSFITSKFLKNNELAYYEIELSKLLQFAHIITNKGLVLKPFVVRDKNSTIFINHTIVPYNNVNDWNSTSIIEFYEEYPLLLDQDTGLSILSLPSDDKKPSQFVELFNEHKKAKKSIDEWITELCALQGIKVE